MTYLIPDVNSNGNFKGDLTALGVSIDKIEELFGVPFVEAYGINTNYRDLVARIEELGRPH